MPSITEHNRKWWVFFGMAAALSVVFLDQTAISVALPPIQKDLQLSNVMTQWVINAYLVPLATIIIFGGKLGDLLGHKRVFLVGITLFVLSSISCAISTSSFHLIISRIIQGIGGAFMIPVTGAMIAHAFGEKERGKAMGLYIAVASIFLSLGPLLSGILVYYLSWHWIFWINIPISLISIFLTVIAVPHSKSHQKSVASLDWIGFVTFSIFITALVIALMEGVNFGWRSTEIISLFLISGFFAAAFIYTETKAADPLIHLSLFRQKKFFGANLCLLLFTCAFSSSVFWAILLQDVMEYSSIATGLFYLPATIPVMFMAPLGGRLTDKYGPRIPAMTGAALTALGSFWIAFSVFADGYAAMFPGFLLFGLGPSLLYSSVMPTIISSVPLSQMGMASGISNGIRQTGRVLGVALIGSVISNIEHYRITHTITTISEELKRLPGHQLMNFLSNPALTKNILPGLERAQLHTTLKSIFISAFSTSMALTGILTIFACICGLLLPNKPQHRTAETILEKQPNAIPIE